MGCGALVGSKSTQVVPRPPSPPAPEPQPQVEMCQRSGCSKPTWNGEPGYCTKFCKHLVESPPICVTPGCGKPTWDGKPDGYCSRTCKSNGLSDGARPSRSTGGPTSAVVELSPGDPRYDSILKQYMEKWDSSRCSPTPVKAIYEIIPKAELQEGFENCCNRIGNVPVFGMGKNPGNVQRRFHGTRQKCNFAGTPCSDKGCCVCRIIEEGFDISKLGSWSGNKGDYGGGIYFTSMSSTAKGYGLDKAHGYSFNNGNWMKPEAGSAIFVSLIACGRVENVDGKCSDAVDSSQYESRKIDKSTGVDELVIFTGSQVLVRYLITF
mmetsp:Transcript_116459/g.362788  ORF Transcript_116459/g.362788 Transcript_116459/m.362788 type:complete len:322 (-) Transcript_116459:177-1142(-)